MCVHRKETEMTEDSYKYHAKCALGPRHPQHWASLMNSVNIRIKAFSVVNVWIVYHFLSPLECCWKANEIDTQPGDFVQHTCVSMFLVYPDAITICYDYLASISKYLIDEWKTVPKCRYYPYISRIGFNSLAIMLLVCMLLFWLFKQKTPNGHMECINAHT